MAGRKTRNGWSTRWDEAPAAAARRDGWWINETAADFAARLAFEDPDRLIVADDRRRLSAKVLHDEALALAGAMVRRGLPPGSVISFMLPNWHEATVIYLAATMAGLVAHPIVPALRDLELGFMLADIGSRMIFIPERFRDHDYVAMLGRVNAELRTRVEVVVVRGGPGAPTAYADMLASGAGTPRFYLPDVDPDSVKLALYTSGTTGRPKGVLHSHNSIHALVRQIAKNWLVEPGDRFFVPSPISHIGGSIYAFELPLIFGTSAILQQAWNADEAVATMLAERCTHMAGATPFLDQLLAAARRHATRLPELKLFICGGASVPPVLIRSAAAYFERAIVTRVFGSTEVPVTTIGALDRADVDHAAETDGRIGIADVRVVISDRGQRSSEGEICVRGPQMLVGYLWPEDEQDSFDEDGYFRTGDLGAIVDGDYLVVTGRAKDIIIRQGENISPKEIEDILIDHPLVDDVAIVGLPDPRTGERACAVIVANGDGEPTLGELVDFLKQRQVARFKLPEQLVLSGPLPRNAAGKVLKHELRAMVLATAAADERV